MNYLSVKRIVGYVFVAGAALSITVDAAAGGVCFDVVDSNQIDRHFSNIKSKFSAVRVYETQMGNTNAIAAAAKAGLQIAAGVWIRSGQQKIDADVNAIVEGINKFPGTVIAVYVGNEDLATGVSESVVVQHVNAVKQRLASTGVPVGSVQVDGDFLNAPTLAAACDVVGVNIYPYFGSSPASISNPIEDLSARWRQVTSKFGGRAKLTETGWPTSGTYNGHIGNYANAKAYWEAYSQWSYGNGGGAPFYFQYKDIAGKQPEYEAHFGLMDGSGSWKFDVAPAPPAPPVTTAPPPPPPTAAPTAAPTTAAPTTAAPTTAAPTTAAPTTTLTPAPTTTAATPVPTPEPTTTKLTPEPTTETPEPTNSTLSNSTDSSPEFLNNSTSTNSSNYDSSNSTDGGNSTELLVQGSISSTDETQADVPEQGAVGSGNAPGAVGSAGAPGAAAGAGAGAGAGASDAAKIGENSINVASANNTDSNPTPTILLSACAGLAVAAAALFVVRRRAQSLEEEKDVFDPEFGLDMPQTSKDQFTAEHTTPAAPVAPVAQVAAPQPQQQREPSLFDPKDSLMGVAMLEDRPSTMLETMEDIRESDMEVDGVHVSIDGRDTMELLDNDLNTVRSNNNEILL